jgi:hypothetical protein
MPSHQPKKYRDSQRHLPPANGGIADYRGVGLAGKAVNLLLATATAASLSRNYKKRFQKSGDFLVSRFRSSHHCAAQSFANFGIKGTLAIYDSSAVFGFEVPTQTRGYK